MGWVVEKKSKERMDWGGLESTWKGVENWIDKIGSHNESEIYIIAILF